MTKRFKIAYYYVSPNDLERIKAFLSLAGDSEKSLITQFVRGWLSKNRDYYLTLAERDALARDISFAEWGETVYNRGIDELPNFKSPVGTVSPDPLRDIKTPPDAERRTLNYISLGVQNYCLFQVGLYYDRDSAIGFVSRIVREHLERNWDKLYAPQVEAENFQNWKFRERRE